MSLSIWTSLTCPELRLHAANICLVGSNRSITVLPFVRTVAERFEPSSRTFLIGEQPNAWELLHPRAKVSRHRGAELRRRYGRLGGTSLLSPE